MIDISNFIMTLYNAYSRRKNRFADVVDNKLASIILTVLSHIIKIVNYIYRLAKDRQMEQDIIESIRLRAADIEITYNSLIEPLSSGYMDDEVMQQIIRIQKNFSAIMGLFVDTDIVKTISDEIVKLSKLINELEQENITQLPLY